VNGEELAALEKQATSFVIIERLGRGGFSYIRVKTKR